MEISTPRCGGIRVVTVEIEMPLARMWLVFGISAIWRGLEVL